MKKGKSLSHDRPSLNLYNNTRMRRQRTNTQRETYAVYFCIFHKDDYCASRPYIEGRSAFTDKRLVFRLFSTPKRLLAQADNGFTA